MTLKFKLSALVSSHPTPEESQHLVNMTESSITPRSIDELDLKVPTNLPLEHGREKGLSGLCGMVAERYGVDMEDVLVTVGASSGIYFVQTALLGPGDHLVMMRPNYPLNIEGAETTGCDISCVDLDFDSGFRVDIDRIAAAIRPETKLISICNPNNPAGTIMSTAELQALAEVARSHDCYLLVDETYSDLLYDGRLPGAASLGSHVIGVSSMSKTWGVSGLRVGWITTKNKQLMDTFVAAKQIISITAGILDETLAEQIMAKADKLHPPIIAELKQRRDLVDSWIRSEVDLLEWILPVAGATGFVRVKQIPPGGMDAFHKRLRSEHHTAVIPGKCFEQPDECFRLGFGYPPSDQVEKGLKAISRALRG
ncbi:aspartate aminotransferase, putative [Paecilomyces variotii No. 5]|uniref:Aspartate aminotransferase, putative n=1 Tax=Byssochlamys spectabilis (strain No. 5 / NBRC 109023) TaxID=1356009 RepID=V5HU82_BYSSN|nr:aspartate aminotransferase, putative [Paecilomyces variotii No. 5]